MFRSAPIRRILLRSIVVRRRYRWVVGLRLQGGRMDIRAIGQERWVCEGLRRPFVQPLF